MARIDVSEYQQDFDRFLAGNVIQSPTPELVGFIDEDLKCALRGTKYAASFGVHQITYLGVDGRTVREPDIPDEISRKALYTFCETTESGVSDVDFAYGMFSKMRQMRQRSDVVKPHMDSAEGDNETEPVYISLMGVGLTTLFFEGSVVKFDDFGTLVKPLEGRWRRMKEGGIYLLKPTTVHCQPKAPLRPVSRFSWRHFHV